MAPGISSLSADDSPRIEASRPPLLLGPRFHPLTIPWVRGGRRRSLALRARAEELVRHPKVGASWEGFALEAVAARLGTDLDDCYFWRTHTGAELDLLVVEGGRRLGFEFKRTTAPRVTRSIHSALSDLRLERVDVVHAGERTFPLAERVRALALGRLWEDLEP